MGWKFAAVYVEQWRCCIKIDTNNIGDWRIIRTPGYSKQISLDRLWTIWCLLHCVSEDDPNLDKNDEVYKSWLVFSYLLRKFQEHNILGSALSIDERIVPTNNKLSFRQYIQDNPVKWGIKTFVMSDSENNCIFNAENYTGRMDDAVSIPILNVTSNLVFRLVNDFSRQTYCMFTDRFSTSVQLAEYLLRYHDIMIITATTKRKFFPETIVKNKINLTWVDSQMLFNGNMSVSCGWIKK